MTWGTRKIIWADDEPVPIVRHAGEVPIFAIGMLSRNTGIRYSRLMFTWRGGMTEQVFEKYYVVINDEEQYSIWRVGREGTSRMARRRRPRFQPRFQGAVPWLHRRALDGHASAQRSASDGLMNGSLEQAPPVHPHLVGDRPPGRADRRGRLGGRPAGTHLTQRLSAIVGGCCFTSAGSRRRSRRWRWPRRPGGRSGRRRRRRRGQELPGRTARR